MALQASGAISMGDVNTELGYSATATISLNDSAVRTLFGVASGAIALSNGYGKSNVTYALSTASQSFDGGNASQGFITFSSAGTAYLAGFCSNGVPEIVVFDSANNSFISGHQYAGTYMGRGPYINSAGDTLLVCGIQHLSKFSVNTTTKQPSYNATWTRQNSYYVNWFGGSVQSIGPIGYTDNFRTNYDWGSDGNFYNAHVSYSYYGKSQFKFGYVSVVDVANITLPYVICLGIEAVPQGIVQYGSTWNIATPVVYYDATVAGYTCALVKANMSTSTQTNSANTNTIHTVYGENSEWVLFTPTTGASFLYSSAASQFYLATYSQLNSNPSYKVTLLTAYNTYGTPVWCRQTSPYADTHVPTALSTDSSGNVYVLTYNYNNQGQGRLSKFNSSGTLQWTRNLTCTINGGQNAQMRFNYAKMGIIGTKILIYVVAGGSAFGMFLGLPTDGSKTGTFNIVAYTSYSYAFTVAAASVLQYNCSYSTSTKTGALTNSGPGSLAYTSQLYNAPYTLSTARSLIANTVII